MPLKYTIIQHTIRRQFDLSYNEYVLCDMIYFLSVKTTGLHPGWCYMARETMAEEMGLSKRAVISIIDRLIDMGLVFKNESTKHLKSTTKWQDTYYQDGEETALMQGEVSAKRGEVSSLQSGEETSPNNNSIYNKKKDKDTRPMAEIIKEKKDKLFSAITAYKKANPDKYPYPMYEVFFSWWSEESNDGKKIRRDAQDFWSLAGRLATFKKRAKPDELNSWWIKHNESKKTEVDLFNQKTS